MSLLKKLISTVLIPLVPVNLEIVDGNEALYHTNWPKLVLFHTFASPFAGHCRTLPDIVKTTMTNLGVYLLDFIERLRFKLNNQL